MTSEIKYPIGYIFALRIPFYLLQCRCNTCTNTINNDMIHFISPCDHIGSSILTLLALHHCASPLALSLAQASPSHVVSRFEAFDLPFTFATGPLSQVMSWSSHLDHITQCYVSCAISSFINTCVSIATSSSHLYCHGICCLHTCTYGLISSVSHINTISPCKVVTQLPKSNKDLLISSFLVIDDNSTMIWKLSSFGFMLLAQAILSCVNDFG
jgi:hypothetical protein